MQHYAATGEPKKKSPQWAPRCDGCAGRSAGRPGLGPSARSMPARAHVAQGRSTAPARPHPPRTPPSSGRSAPCSRRATAPARGQAAARTGARSAGTFPARGKQQRTPARGQTSIPGHSLMTGRNATPAFPQRAPCLQVGSAVMDLQQMPLDFLPEPNIIRT